MQQCQASDLNIHPSTALSSTSFTALPSSWPLLVPGRLQHPRANAASCVLPDTSTPAQHQPSTPDLELLEAPVLIGLSNCPHGIHILAHVLEPSLAADDGRHITCNKQHPNSVCAEVSHVRVYGCAIGKCLSLLPKAPPFPKKDTLRPARQPPQAGTITPPSPPPHTNPCAPHPPASLSMTLHSSMYLSTATALASSSAENCSKASKK